MLHVPLAFYGPGVPKGKKISTPVTNINIFPTARDLLNLPPGEDDEGQSLTGLFSGEDKNIRPNFVEFFNRFRGVIFNNYYLVKNYITNDIKHVSLTDLENDPRQKVDIKDKYPEVMAQGMGLIEEFEKTRIPPKNQPYNERAVKELNKTLKSLGYTHPAGESRDHLIKP
jgi:arylsulfatase A-like enzyme